MKWLILLLMMFPVVDTISSAETIKVWAVGKESKVSILGSSNVNTFAFDVKEYNGKDTLIAIQKQKQVAVFFRKGILRIPVEDFKNGNPMLTRDFKKTIKAKNFPEIIMNFRNLNFLPEPGAQNQKVNAEVEIVVAGKNKIFQFPLVASRLGNTIYVKGDEKMNFSDFGLVPPNKVLGFINVNNELSIHFQLALKVVAEG